MNNKSAIVPLLILCASVVGCNGIQFSTNIGTAISNQVSTTLVREYTPAEIDQYNAITLGIVEASHCQKRIDASEAHKSALIKDLKLRTINLGGNGIVVEACGTAKFAGCYSYMECRGLAYAVPERKGKYSPNSTNLVF